MFLHSKITLSDIFYILKITLSATKVVVYFGLCKYFSHKYYQSPKFIFLKHYQIPLLHLIEVILQIRKLITMKRTYFQCDLFLWGAI